MKCFTVYADEIEGRIDPLYLKNISIIKNPKTLFKLVPLGDLLKDKVQYGANERAIEGNPEEDIRYIRITDIDEYGNLKKDEWKTAERADNKYLLQENDILFARSGATAGKVFIYKKEFEKAIYAGYLIRFKIDENKANPKFVFFYTQLKRYNTWVKSIQRPSGQPNINSEEFKSFEIPLPPIGIQNKIVSLMEKAYSQKKQKETEAQRLLDSINDYVFGELGIKFPELKDKMTYAVNSDEVRNNRADAYYYQPKFEEVEKAIEKGKFEVKELKELVEFIPGYAFSSNDYVHTKGTKLLTIKNIREKSIDLNEVTLLPEDFYNEYKKFQVKKDDIVIAMTGATIGKSFIFNIDDKVLLNQRVGIIRLSKKLNNLFLLAFMKTSIFRQKIFRQSCGGAQPNISESEILSINIPFPPITVQNKIASEVKRRMRKAEQLQKESKEDLEEAKKEVEKIILGEK